MRTAPFAALKSLFAISDEQAMWRVQTQEDAAAFARLVRRWEKPIQSLCARMTGDPHRAEDLAQEAFARVFERRGDFQASGKFSTWLWRIALNLCYDDLRRARRRGECSFEAEFNEEHPDANLLDESVGSPDGAALENERAEFVRSALLRLSEAHRSVLVLRHYEGLKFREIAEVLGVPEGTVKSRMAEALTQLERALQPLLDDKPRPKPGPILRPKPFESLIL